MLLSEFERTPLWRRRSASRAVREAVQVAYDRRALVDELEEQAAPHVALVRTAEEDVREAERLASTGRIRERLEHLPLRAPTRHIDRGVEIDLPGM